MDRQAIIERYEDVCALRNMGYSYREIGEKYGVTRQCIHTIYKKSKPSFRDRNEALERFSGRDRTREMVRIRDKHTCQNCGKVWVSGTRRFDVHHLNGMCGKMSQKYDKVSDIDGLVTLCHKCHFNHPEHSYFLL